MLATLRKIVQAVTSARNLQDALQIMVDAVCGTVQTQAATIFLINNYTSQYILMATQGLNMDAVGKVRFGLDEGLVGVVGRREEPINLADAPRHPDYLDHPDLREDAFQAFLGVPIIHQRRLFGVLTIQQEDERHFDEAEEAFLVTLAAHLGGVIAAAEATGALSQLEAFAESHQSPHKEKVYNGIPSVPGVGVGVGVVVYPPADLEAIPDKHIDPVDVEKEITDFTNAMDKARAEIERMSERLKKNISAQDHALFDVYLKVLDKKGMGGEIIKNIREEHLWAQAALKRVVKKYIVQFEAMDDAYLRERASDFKDLGHRILAHLQASQVVDIDYPKQTILIGEEISPGALADVPEGLLKAVVSVKGSNNSHVAILARALGVPTVMGTRGIALNTLSEREIIVDGYFGQVYVNPSPEVLREFERLSAEEDELNQSLDELRDKPAETLDNHTVSMQVNTGLAADASLSMSVGAEGIGLYRSEVPFLTRDRFPSESEQKVIYRQLLKAFAPRSVTMRTLDVGGDKNLPYFPVVEENPFLGWRGIRITLDHPDVFLIQIRAMLKASEGLDNLQIMFPMITSVGEVDEAIHLVEQAYNECLEEGLKIQYPKIGVMIEVPSALYQARELARRVDFLSVGSNDLTQYLLAVDRNNARVAGLYDALHPAVLKALTKVVEGAHTEGKPISICGEMAADPAAVIVLLAMDFDILSMNSTSLPRVKWVIRNFSLQTARKLLSEVLDMDNPTLIRFHLEKALDSAGLGGLIRAGKL